MQQSQLDKVMDDVRYITKRIQIQVDAAPLSKRTAVRETVDIMHAAIHAAYLAGQNADLTFPVDEFKPSK